MTPLEITKLIVADLDSRGLKNPNIRKNALKRVWEYKRPPQIRLHSQSSS